MVEDLQAFKYTYGKQLVKWALTFLQAMSGMMRIRMCIALRLHGYEEFAHLLLLDFVLRMYIFAYQGLAVGAELRLCLHALAPRPVGVLPRLQDDHASDLL